ncbi:hypothetical protein D3C72_1857640 [compost metagenome]
MTQESIANGLFGLRKTIAIPRNSRTREVERVTFRVHHHFDGIGVKRFFRVVNRHGQCCHSDLALREIFRDLADNHRRDHRLVALHINDYRVIAKTAFFDDFGQPFGARLVIRARHAHFAARRFDRTRNLFMIRGHNHALGTRFTRPLENVNNHRLTVNIDQRFAR